MFNIAIQDFQLVDLGRRLLQGEESRYHSHCIYSRNYEKAIHLFIVYVSTQVYLVKQF